MEAVSQILGIIFTFIFVLIAIWAAGTLLSGWVDNRVLKKDLVPTVKKLVAEQQNNHSAGPISEKIEKTPQEEVAEAVRFALRVGVTPDQIKEIVVNEVRQRQG